MSSISDQTWFQCDRCTACCKWPGDVKITEQEAESIAQFLELPLHTFIEQFTRLRQKRNGLSLIEKKDHSCIMLENNLCKIQGVKPSQCKGFPNQWNFEGWQKICHAKPVPMSLAIKKGLVNPETLASINSPLKGSDLPPS